MQLPVDIKAVFDEADRLDTARQTPVFAAVYIDESAPQDVQAFVRASFSTMASNARVSIMYYPAMTPAPVPEADLAVVVAGLDETTGGVAQMLREAGVPTMVVTTLPRLAGEIAQTAGNAIPEGDLLAPPAPPTDPSALPEEAGQAEPWPLGRCVPCCARRAHGPMGHRCVPRKAPCDGACLPVRPQAYGARCRERYCSAECRRRVGSVHPRRGHAHHDAPTKRRCSFR